MPYEEAIESEILDIIDACYPIWGWITGTGAVQNIIPSMNYLEDFIYMGSFDRTKTLYRATRIPIGAKTDDWVEYYNGHYKDGELKSWSESIHGIKFFLGDGRTLNADLILVADVPLYNIVISVKDFYEFLQHISKEFPEHDEFKTMIKSVGRFVDEEEVIVYMDRNVEIISVMNSDEIYK